MADPPTSKPRARRRLLGLALLALVLAALAAVAVPIWLIRPFVPQTARGVDVAFWFHRLAPFATVVAAALALAIAASLWRGARWWTRIALVLVPVILVAAAWAARQNIYERMFRPLPQTASIAASAANWVAPTDPVLVVAIGADAAAYPVRQIAYHHVAHDVVGGVPIVATY
jgi:Protein of unknown function (DUF3179)